MKILSPTIRKQHGFTLLELLLFIAITAICIAIVVVSVKPDKYQIDSRNLQRTNNVRSIARAIYDYALDHNGTVPPTIHTKPADICATGTRICSGFVDLSLLIRTGYLSALPRDPLCSKQCARSSTGYTVVLAAENRIVVSAPKAENGLVIVEVRRIPHGNNDNQ